MGRDLTNLFVSESFQYLIQQSGSEFQNGLGTKVTGTIDITSQYANIALAANSAATAISSSFATTASYALSAGVIIVNSGSFIVTASALGDTTTYTKGDGSTFNTVISSVTQSISASYATTALSASYSNNSTSSSYSDFALTASFALNSVTVNTGSLLSTASVSLNTITFTKGDGSTFPITVNTGSGGGGGSTPIRVTGLTLTSGSWTYSGSYYQYVYSNANINVSTSIDYTPYNTSSYDVLIARIQPYIEPSASACILFSQYLPSNNIIGDLIITTVS
jgi:hypothetical protein